MVDVDTVVKDMLGAQKINYVKLEPYVNESGIWFPCEGYGVEGAPHAYKCLITKELFVEAYEKWIKNDSK
jgi:hypothetical protein